MSKPSLLIASHSATLRGGAELALFELARFLVGAGIIVDVVVPEDGELSRALEAAGCTVHSIESGWWLTGDATTALSAKGYTALSALIAELKPSLVATNTLASPWMAFAAAAKGYPHAWLVHELIGGQSQLHSVIMPEAIRDQVWRLSDIIVVNSQTTLRYMSDGLNDFPTPALVLPPFLFPPQEPESARVVDPARFTIVCVGRVIPAKGQSDLIGSLAHLTIDRPIDIFLVGEYDTHYSEGFVVPDNVTLHMVGHTDTPYDYVATADLVVSCSRTESFSRNIYEAMSLGKIVIASDIDVSREGINDGVNGFLYKTGDSRSLASVIMGVYRLGDTEKQSIGAAARKTAEATNATAIEQARRFASMIAGSTKVTHSHADPLIAALIESLETTGSELAAAREELLGADQKLADSSATHQDLHGEITALRKAIDRDDAIIAEIKGSRAWKAVERARSIKDKLYNKKQ